MNKLQQKPKFSVALQTESYQTLISNTLKDPARANKFIADITTVVSINPTLQECEAGSILAAGFMAESLKMSMSPNLGYCYLIPYDVVERDKNGNIIYLTDENGNFLKDAKGYKKKQTVKKAQFQLGYKGLIQLAIRSGQYRKLNVMEIKEGELVSFDTVTEEIKLNTIMDDEKREETETIGYYAMLEYLNGFRKAIYWTKERMLRHADKYSAAFSSDNYAKLQRNEIPDNELWKYSSFWYQNFDEMGKKTMLRQLIGKWGVISIKFQTALERDMSVIDEDGSYTYVDNPNILPQEIPIEIPMSDEQPQEISFDELD